MLKELFSFKTKHTGDMRGPQTYYEHFMVAVPKSWKLLIASVGGIIHGFLPEIKRFQFSTSTTIFKTAQELMMMSRHDEEIEEIFGRDMLEFIRRKRVEAQLKRSQKPPHM